jgi:hypothetical protein
MMVIKAHLHSHYINHETIINYRKFVETNTNYRITLKPFKHVTKKYAGTKKQYVATHEVILTDQNILQ